jgi:hypothetical protein
LPRSVPVSLFRAALTGRHAAVAWTAALLLACASDGTSPPPDLDATWRDFLALPAERALAIAGDPVRDRWVAGASGGHATRAQAEAEALSECQRRRAIRRLRVACEFYAVGDEIVWRAP